MGKQVCISGEMHGSSSCEASIASTSAHEIVGLLQLLGTFPVSPQQGITLHTAAEIALQAALPGKVHVSVPMPTHTSDEGAGTSRRLSNSSVRLFFAVTILDDLAKVQGRIASILSDAGNLSDMHGAFVMAMAQHGFNGIDSVNVLGRYDIETRVANARLLNLCKGLSPSSEGICGMVVAASSQDGNTWNQHEEGKGKTNTSGNSHQRSLFILMMLVLGFFLTACCISIYVQQHAEIRRPFFRADSDYIGGPSVLGKQCVDV